MDYLNQHIEALIFAAETPIPLQEIKQTLEAVFNTRFKEPVLTEAMAVLIGKYQDENHAFEIIEIAGGFQFMTKGAYHQTVGQLLKIHSRKKLSRAALETLSIIAYKQPVTKSEIEKIRGVGCDYTIQKLLEKELVSIQGRSDGPGRPLLYATSQKFMDYFSLRDLKDLPKLKDFKEPESEIGEKAPIEEVATGAPENGQSTDLHTLKNEAPTNSEEKEEEE